MFAFTSKRSLFLLDAKYCTKLPVNLSNSSNYITGQQIEKTINYNLSALEQFNIDYSSNTAELGNGNAGSWDASNMSVIAYIYNNTTQEILQVEDAHLNN